MKMNNRGEKMGIIGLDLETTGINPEHNRIIEIGAIRIETGEVFHVLVNPNMPLKEKIVEALGK